MESVVKDCRLHEYMIAFFADVQSVRHSCVTQHTEKKSENEWRSERRKGSITPLYADELSLALIIRGTRGREKEREKRPPTWTQVGSFRNFTKPRRCSQVVPASCHLLCLPYKNDKTLFIKLPRNVGLAPFRAHES